MAATSSAFISADEALERLGIRKASLYSYASRGLIRTRPHPTDPRARLYSKADVDALITKKARRKPGRAAATALDWGMPVLETRLSRIEGGTLEFRGRNAVAFAETATLETTAELLWGVPMVRFGRIKTSRALDPRLVRPPDRAIARLAAILPDDRPGLAGLALIAGACTLVPCLAEGAAGARLPSGPMHEALATAWDRTSAADILRRALVLCADHELNASSFAVRVAASTGASLTHSLIAGLATLSGPAHGGATERAARFLDEAAEARSPAAAVNARLGRGEPLPGFGHQLYPDGDPRAAALLGHIDLPRPISAMIGPVEDMTGLRPNVDIALAAIERSYRLPGGAALAIFAVGRSVGWVAHAIEQRATGQLIRPRARYVG